MLISEFARRAALTPDTIRFYVRKGLIKPEQSAKGGSNPYQIFTEEHLDAARLIRLAQSLGFSLREIAAIGDEYAMAGLTTRRKIELMQGQLDQLDAKAEQINAVRKFFRAKIAWLEKGEKGPEPRFNDTACG